MFVYCHLTCVCENFQHRLFILATMAPPPQIFSMTMSTAALVLPETLAKFVDMTTTIVT